MSDLNTGTRNLAREDAREDEPPTPYVPGAFPGESNKAQNPLSAGMVVPQTRSVISGDSQQPGSNTASPRSADGKDQEAPISTAINNRDPSNHTAHPTAGIQPSLRQKDDDRLASAAEEQVLEQVACPIEARPKERQERMDRSQNTVTAAKFAQELAAGATGTAIAAAQAASDAAKWATNKAIENYPGARDTTVNAASAAGQTTANAASAAGQTTAKAASAAGQTTAKAASAAGQTTANAASAAGQTTQSAFKNVSDYLPESVKNALGTTSSPDVDQAKTAPGVPDTVRSSIQRSGQSPEAAANPEAVHDKEVLESQLLKIAKAAGVDSDAEINARKGTHGSSKDVPSHMGATTGAATGAGTVATSAHREEHKPRQPEMPNRAESTNYVKILGTETIKHQIHSTGDNGSRQPSNSSHLASQAQAAGTPSDFGRGVDAIQQSPAHGGGPAGSAPVLHSAQLHDSMPMSLQAQQRHDNSPSTVQSHAAGMGSAVAAGGVGYGLSTFSHSAEHPTRPQPYDEQPRSTGTATHAPGHGVPIRQSAPQQQSQPPPYGQSQYADQKYSGVPGNATRGHHEAGNGLACRGQQIDIEYNTLGSGTQSGVANTHVHRN